MTTSESIRLKAPSHPGGFLKHEVLEPLELSVTTASHILGVTRPTLSALLNERAHLSPEMALRFEKAFGISMDTLMRMQNSYDIAQARKREANIVVAPYKQSLKSLPDAYLAPR
ncbi:MAG: addiction module antidote protein, HigA family [Rhodospirillaceae bacterium]|jgi:addiction module HigA family antidote|uniref:HigA family addiction module antitoxin n=1 Tax=unclassified Hwanghaeella TaxID=2605944 RepID=UPI000C62154E|nr:addiction module antidote protein, HigA family [Rhodospirillaceae bacterium]MAO93631.1 addiction module antidote protein, HigA family [Rhodospirillales bacterium]MAX46633.1 addiction module antidote protein, HigA family [Rhodospirillaceae bacterium]MAX64208.1 addiction module antidote protein, HigA family [Rhodospirillaceae bacterium]MBB58119.1 addiction module antidote protein, HigA family [Rhodospirillaceae bacterium]|tara:strand:- start:20 stop:361 length:342 start_codon:yes stop_codon:yes gene_type:complete